MTRSLKCPPISSKTLFGFIPLPFAFPKRRTDTRTPPHQRGPEGSRGAFAQEVSGGARSGVWAAGGCIFKGIIFMAAPPLRPEPGARGLGRGMRAQPLTGPAVGHGWSGARAGRWHAQSGGRRRRRRDASSHRALEHRFPPMELVGLSLPSPFLP